MRTRIQREILVLAATTVLAVACSSSDRAPRQVARPSPAPGAIAVDPDRVAVFVGDPIAVTGTGEALRVEPPLPAGVALDTKTGAVTGTPSTAMPPTSYLVAMKTGDERVLMIEVVAAPGPDDRFVAPTGDDAADGSRAHPVRTIATALAGAGPGRRIFLAGGRYREDVHVQKQTGTADRPIVIRSVPGEHASIEGEQPTITWERATAAGAAADEWVSVETFERDKNESTSRGAFADRQPFTHLLTYSRGEDLRAANQLWSRDGSAPGGTAVTGPQRPWTYMGPGLWHDPDTGRVHLRLSPTTNAIAGLEDYTGPTDPKDVALSIWARSSTPLRIDNSSYIELRDLSIVGGGERTVAIDRSDHVTFDHADIMAATMGLTIGDSTAIRYLNGRMDGGIPPWSFRSDFKDNYKVKDEDDGSVAEDNLVRKTSRALLFVSNGNREIEIAYSELTNAHDVYMAGEQSSLHHCSIRNIHDEALFIGHSKDIDDLRIHHNVIERVLSAVSAKVDRESGPRFIYRNIFDLREPTAGFRPGGTNPGAWRWGHLFKGGIASAFYFYQNTVLLPQPKPGKPALWHYKAFEKNKDAPTNPRWFVNNVVVVGGGTNSPLAFVPDPSYLAAKTDDGRPLLYSDGNAWVQLDTPNVHGKRRKNGGAAPLFRCASGKGGSCSVPRWASIDDVRGATGFERHSVIVHDAGFARMAAFDASTPGDDLRPGANSPALGIAVDLPKDLPDDDRGTSRDAGALGPGAPPLRVGVDGRLRY